MKFCSSLLPRLRWWFIAKKSLCQHTVISRGALSGSSCGSDGKTQICQDSLSISKGHTGMQLEKGRTPPKHSSSCPASELKLQYFLIFNLWGGRKQKIEISLNHSKFRYFQFPIFKSYISPFWPYGSKINDLRICLPPPFLLFSSSVTSPKMYHVT